MNESSLPTESNSQQQQLAEEMRSLRTLLNWSMFAGVILSGALAVYFLREVIVIRRQISSSLQYVNEYETSIDNLRGKFQAFAKTNPDFAPLVQRYFTTNAPGTAPSLPALPPK